MELRSCEGIRHRTNLFINCTLHNHKYPISCSSRINRYHRSTCKGII
nr:MAG TPA: hypothetical protein [Bacteriophage sp.]